MRTTFPTTLGQGQGHRLRILVLKFYIKVDLITTKLNDIVPVWYYDRYWSKVFISTISAHDRDLEIEVTDLEFKC